MLAECYEVPSGELFLLHSMQGQFPHGCLIRPDDLELNHPEYPDADGFYPHALCVGMDMRVFPEIDTSNWSNPSTAKLI